MSQAGKGKANAQQDLEQKLQAAKDALSEQQQVYKAAQEASNPIRRERVFHLTESEQIRKQIDILKSRIQDMRLQIKAKEREAEEIEDRTRTEIQVYKQKVKHLMHTHRKDLTAIEEDKKATEQAQITEHQDALRRFETDAQHISSEFMTQQSHHAMQQKQQKEEYDRQTQRLKEQYATNLQEIDDEHNKNMETLFEDYELQRINELHEIQERKDHHIRRLMKSHDKAFQEMRAFYNNTRSSFIYCPI